MRKKLIEEFATEKLGKELAAGMDHFRRVYKLAKSLGLKYNDEVLHAACFLHDLGEDEPHQNSAAKTAEKFLKKINFPQEKTSLVKEAILEHVPLGRPKGNEAILLHDADLLDFLGATGVVRLSIGAWDWMGKDSLMGVLEVLKKFRQLASENLVLTKSKQLAEEKIKFMNQAIRQLEKEIS